MRFSHEKKTLKRKRIFKSSKKRYFDANASGRVMLWNIKKVLHCHFSDLSAHLCELEDPRKCEMYTIVEMVMSAIVLFILNCQSRNAFNIKARENMFHNNYRRLFALELPHMDAINDFFKLLDFKKMEEIRCQLVSRLIEKRVFHKFRFFEEYSHIVIDGT
jgi:dipeptide/tripeptide permease